MPERDPPAGPFEIKDCAITAIATGRRVHALNELRDALQSVTKDSIYYHFWGGLLQPRFEDREYNNDFAAWTCHHINDGPLAERLAVIDPTDYPDLEDLRQELIELIEQRLEESEYLLWVRTPEPFEFIRAQIVVFKSHRRVTSPEELAELIPHLSPSTIFYHFVDARRRPPEGGVDDFRLWLKGFGERYVTLVERLRQLDPYFVPLTQLRAQMAGIFRECIREQVDAG